MVLPPLKYTWHTMFSANSFYAFTQAFCIWYNYVASFVDGVSTLAAFFWIIWSTDLFLILCLQSLC